jgi:putative iron-regulated protein
MQRLGFLLSVLLIAACGDDDDTQTPSLDDTKPAIAAYADVVEKGYAESLAGAEALHTALVTFTTTPSEANLQAAKDAWIAARLPYRQTEAWRFYGGPIDDPDDEREGRINAGPLDEQQIDYVEGKPESGLVNDVAGTPAINKAVIVETNFQNGEADVKTGYHAIEFLLWGQDLSADGPGARPYTDYLEDESATAPNGARRKAYLLAVSELLVEDLEHVHGRWAEGGDYRAVWLAKPPAEALTSILSGVGTLATAELSGERMLTAYENKDQEDEHSCFSDTTKDDIWGNAKSLEDTYLGKFGAFDSVGLDEVIAARNPDLDMRVKNAMIAALAAIDAIPGSFDTAILGDDTAEGRVRVLAAVRAVQAVGELFVEVAEELDVPINNQLE